MGCKHKYAIMDSEERLVANAIKRLRNELLIIQGKKALPGSTPHAVEGWTATPVESSRDVFDRTISL